MNAEKIRRTADELNAEATRLHFARRALDRDFSGTVTNSRKAAATRAWKKADKAAREATEAARRAEASSDAQAVLHAWNG